MLMVIFQNISEQDDEEDVLKDLESVLDKDAVENLRRERGESVSKSREDLQRSTSRESSPKKRAQSERKDSTPGTTLIFFAEQVNDNKIKIIQAEI